MCCIPGKIWYVHIWVLPQHPLFANKCYVKLLLQPIYIFYHLLQIFQVCSNQSFNHTDSNSENFWRSELYQFHIPVSFWIFCDTFCHIDTKCADRQETNEEKSNLLHNLVAAVSRSTRRQKHTLKRAIQVVCRKAKSYNLHRGSWRIRTIRI